MKNDSTSTSSNINSSGAQRRNHHQDNNNNNNNTRNQQPSNAAATSASTTKRRPPSQRHRTAAASARRVTPHADGDANDDGKGNDVPSLAAAAAVAACCGQKDGSSSSRNSRLLVLHGNRQTGTLLLGRMDKLRRTLQKPKQPTNPPNHFSPVELIAVDAPHFYLHSDRDHHHHGGNNNINNNNNSHSNDAELRTWWHRRDDPSNTYEGLHESVELVRNVWQNTATRDDTTAPFRGLLGFSQGARLVHLLAVLHQAEPETFLPGLRYVILVANYDAPWPANYPLPPVAVDVASAENENENTRQQQRLVTLPSLHVWGERDALVRPTQSEAVTHHYVSPTIHVHEGGHHVPMRAASVRTYVDFVQTHCPSYGPTTTTPPTTVSANFNTTLATAALSTPLLLPPQTPPVRNKLPAEMVVPPPIPDDETAWQQREEVEALQAIYPDEFHWLSQCFCTTALAATADDEADLDAVDVVYEHPISYKIDLRPSDQGAWPPPQHLISLQVTYPATYPGDTLPVLQLFIHDDDNQNHSKSDVEQPPPPQQWWTSRQVAEECLERMQSAAALEQGMPCVLSCLLAARDYFESGDAWRTMNHHRVNSSDFLQQEQREQHSRNAQLETKRKEDEDVVVLNSDDDDDNSNDTNCPLLKAVSEQRIQDCNQQGLEIAKNILRLCAEEDGGGGEVTATTTNGKGGSLLFTIGLVGKPSAGKSTLFNSSTGFARQKQRVPTETATSQKNIGDSEVDNNNILGGATMASHPFTTIDPNVGFALVPAPAGSCPEDNDGAISNAPHLDIGSTHGRDSDGRRLVPVLLKDVAGLVPGAYQGRGRGNQFLNDLCDAQVLIHVCDASGMADAEGNVVVVSADEPDTTAIIDAGANFCAGAAQENNKPAKTTANSSSLRQGQNGGASHPLHDMAWIRNELIEWVYTNVEHKWDIIRRKGRTKLAGMFSGYGQPQAMTWTILQAVENFMGEHPTANAVVPQRAAARACLEHLDEWDSGDLHRLISAFLGVRFPIVLALNKMDLPSSQGHIRDILAALPIHGTHAGIPLSARKEMMFVRYHVQSVLRGTAAAVSGDNNSNEKSASMAVPRGTWRCLQSALSLCEPLLVFPVVDHHTYAPLPGMFQYATSDPSLPSPGMISCLQAAGGRAPSEWDDNLKQYKVSKTNSKQKQPSAAVALRDAIMMKPGSTVNDVFMVLKRLGALGGEFVRAEASGEVGAPAKPIPKHQMVTKKTRILKIMTNKRAAWQKA